MAHYALLDENNVVTQVIVGIDENELIEGLDPETWYGNFHNQVCKRTSYNTAAGQHTEGKTPYRKNFASVGYTYDEVWDAFSPPRPFPSWKLDYETFQWYAPIPVPEKVEGFFWRWSEINQEWVKVPLI